MSNDEIEIRLGDVLQGMSRRGFEWTVTGRSKEPAGWDVESGPGNGDGFISDCRVCEHVVIRRAAPEVAKAPEGPPAGYDPCGQGCGRFCHPKSHPHLGCWTCTGVARAIPGDETMKKFPDWTPPGMRGRAEPPKAKPAEAARCTSANEGCCDGVVLRRVYKNGVLPMCDAHHLEDDRIAAELTGGVLVPLPASYTLPKPSPYVCEVDEYDLLPDAGR